MLKEEVFIIGLSCGEAKPSSVDDYLYEFVKELKELVKHGLDYNGKHITIATLDAFIFDAPARAFIKCVKGHSGYYGCERCVQKGEHNNGRMSFPEMNSCLRNDQDFFERSQPSHHT